MTPKHAAALDLDVDLEGGVIPISKAASSLAALFKRAREQHPPIIVTQKGSPTGDILDVELYTTLCARATEAAAGSTPHAEPAAEAPAADSAAADTPLAAAPTPDAAEREAALEAAAPTPGRRGGRRRKAQGDA